MVYLYIGLGGMIGSFLRYYVTEISRYWWGYDFPFGTLLVNLIGSFALGWVIHKMIKSNLLSPQIWTGISTGLIGSFTTFSTFSVEAVSLIQHHLLGLTFIYVSLSFFGGILMSWIGYKMGDFSLNLYSPEELSGERGK